MRSQTAFLFILAVFLSFVCSGCGKETPPLSQQKLLEASTEASLRQIYDDLQKNPKKAEYYYCDTILLLDGEILAITDDTVFLQEGQLHVLCSLPAQSLRTLAIGQTISVVGQTAPRFLAVKKIRLTPAIVFGCELHIWLIGQTEELSIRMFPYPPPPPVKSMQKKPPLSFLIFPKASFPSLSMKKGSP